MRLKPLIPPKEFHERVMPELLRRCDAHCFCRNANFLKLISFNFENYKIAPTALYDSEFVIVSLIFARFLPVEGWNRGGGRVDRCKQCRQQFRTVSEQYSIAMERMYTLPDKPLPMAATGLYLTGFRYFANSKDELDRIDDFRLAESVEAFIDAITKVEA